MTTRHSPALAAGCRSLHCTALPTRACVLPAPSPPCSRLSAAASGNLFDFKSASLLALGGPAPSSGMEAAAADQAAAEMLMEIFRLSAQIPQPDPDPEVEAPAAAEGPPPDSAPESDARPPSLHPGTAAAVPAAAPAPARGGPSTARQPAAVYPDPGAGPGPSTAQQQQQQPHLDADQQRFVLSLVQQKWSPFGGGPAAGPAAAAGFQAAFAHVVKPGSSGSAQLASSVLCSASSPQVPLSQDLPDSVPRPPALEVLPDAGAGPAARQLGRGGGGYVAPLILDQPLPGPEQHVWGLQGGATAPVPLHGSSAAAAAGTSAQRGVETGGGAAGAAPAGSGGNAAAAAAAVAVGAAAGDTSGMPDRERVPHD